MRALDRKLFRDLWNMKGQALAIALVIVGGMATYIMSASTLDSLRLTQATFYRDCRFADVFAELKRAPEGLKARIQAIPGVNLVETRVMASANLDVPGYTDPATGLIVSIPDDGKPLLNQLYLRSGRTVDAGRDDEVLLSESFADAHSFKPGDSLFATINGKRKRLTIVGVALSPEYVYQLEPGSPIPDLKGYGLLWMARTPLGNAYDMDEAFNNVTMSLTSGTQVENVVDRVDDLLERYGGRGATGRMDQLSHRYLYEEFRGLQQMATFFPIVFLSVAAFLLNVVVGRLIATQREQVAILKAFGYSNTQVVVHYLKLVALIVLVGALGGVAVGVWLARALSGAYMAYYHFPFLMYELRPPVAITGALITGAAAAVGTFYSVIKAASRPPAEAMQPPPPARYRVSVIERLGLERWMAQPTRMIVRNLERRPIKALFSVLGIAFGCSIMVVGGVFGDSIDALVDVQFKQVQREDVTVTFAEPTSKKALYSLTSLPAVEYAEPFRSVPARLRFEHRSYRTSIHGVPPDSTLHRLLNTRQKRVDLPPDGVVLTDYLAEILGIDLGDMLTVEVLEGYRPVRQVPVVGFVSEYVGLAGYMQLSALNRLMREGDAISGAYLTTDSLLQHELYSELNQIPRVVGTSVRENALQSFYDTMADQMLTMAFFQTLLAAIIAFGVVYNSARIALSERSRELASLRVLGFTRAEISYILLGELSVLTLAAIPLGFVIGRLLSAAMMRSYATDLFRIPLVIEPATYSMAAVAILVSATLSGLIVRRRLDHLDLVAVLKTKE